MELRYLLLCKVFIAYFLYKNTKYRTICCLFSQKTLTMGVFVSKKLITSAGVLGFL
ncbi:hypothetical protein SPBRAN_162 [uncultured Candidatus Thioglobus sp.]|nr:hypothetical protein SPBRAN_162 [uncultured Candidatus Thioglobus sp.]